MDEFKIISITLFLLQIILANCVPRVIEADVCVYGSTSAGMIAAYTAKKLGKTSFLIEPGIRIGGMTAGGLGWTDFGYKSAIIGYAREFYHRISKHYNKTEQWTFEPKAALEVYQSFLKEVNLTVLYRHELHSVDKNGSKIVSITLK
jgi:NADPH-dependent 2,4-dienoyl-CoA reductase/sulfur reductase-like enzyme